MAALAELIQGTVTQEDKNQLANFMEASLKFVAFGEVIESRSHFIFFDEGGVGPCYACAIGLALIGKLGLRKVRSIAAQDNYQLFLPKVVEMLGCSEQFGRRISNAHLNTSTTLTHIILALRGGRL